MAAPLKVYVVPPVVQLSWTGVPYNESPDFFHANVIDEAEVTTNCKVPAVVCEYDGFCNATPVIARVESVL